MQIRYTLSFIAILLFLNTNTVNAVEPVKIFSIYLKERLSFDQTQGYNKVLKYILQDTYNQFSETIAPLPRASKLFEFTQDACLYPANERIWRSHKPERAKHALISSYPIDLVSVRAYTPVGRPKIRHKTDLYGLRVGHLIGSAGKAILGEPEKISYYGVTSEENLFVMLEKGRLDALLGFHPDVLMLQERLGFNEADFALDYSVFKVPTAILCHDNARNRELISRINQQILKAHTHGVLQKLLGEHAILVPPVKNMH